MKSLRESLTGFSTMLRETGACAERWIPALHRRVENLARGFEMRFHHQNSTTRWPDIFGLAGGACQHAEAGDTAFTELPTWKPPLRRLARTFRHGSIAGNTSIYSTASGYTDVWASISWAPSTRVEYSLEIVNPSLSSYFNYGSGASLDSGLATAAVRLTSRRHCLSA